MLYAIGCTAYPCLSLALQLIHLLTADPDMTHALKDYSEKFAAATEYTCLPNVATFRTARH